MSSLCVYVPADDKTLLHDCLDWCHAYVALGGYVFGWNSFKYQFMFINEEDAVAFKLKFGI